VCYRINGTLAKQLLVQLGGIFKNRQEIDVVYVQVEPFSHPSYNASFVNHGYDIALLKLARPVKFTNRIAPICLPSPDVDLNQFKVCFSTGFGLQKALPGNMFGVGVSTFIIIIIVIMIKCPELFLILFQYMGSPYKRSNRLLCTTRHT